MKLPNFNIWKTISNLGVTEEFSYDEQRRIVFSNRLGLFCGLQTLLVLITTAPYFHKVSYAITIISIILFFSVLFFNKIKQHQLGLYLLAVTVILFVFTSSCSVGFESGDFLSYIPIGICAFLALDVKKKLPIALILSALFISLIILHFSDFSLLTNIKPPEKEIRMMFWFNFYETFIICLFAGYSFSSIAQTQQENIIRNQISLNEKQLKENEYKLMEFQMKILQSQMNPHFIFNSLNSILSFIQQSNKDDATKYLIKFSKLIRQAFENSRSNSIIFNKEINFIKLYLEIEQVRSNNGFEFEIEIDDQIDLYNSEIPIMIIQPFLENAIIHGIENKIKEYSEKNEVFTGKITLKFHEVDNKIICTIIDNGIGRKRASEISNSSLIKNKSLGIILINERLNLLTNNRANIIYSDLIDIKTNQIEGTKVCIELPLIN